MSPKTIFCFLILALSTHVNCQVDSMFSKVSFELDYRFRVEQDWKSRKQDGSFRENRSRLRYRLRAGATYNSSWYSFGARIRTGDPRKQQDPQLTLGKAFKEFGTLPIGFEKAFFQYSKNKFRIWVGKNSYPFAKNNELFWSDNVFPEGILVEKKIPLRSKILDNVNLAVGHFILSSNDNLFAKDAYFRAFQFSLSSLKNRFKFFPSIYFFRNIPNIPDGGHSYLIDYTIVHIGTKFIPIRNGKFIMELDFYRNTENLLEDRNIRTDLMDQKMGFTFGLQYGKIESKNDWLIKLTYANLEKYAILDYMAQNDWARWDYSSFNSPDGRLSNFEGIEVVLSYAVSDKIKLVSKYYLVEQLIPLGTSKETGQRIRFDIDVRL